MSKVQLRDYQAQAFDEIRLEFRANNFPVLFVLPTGGGKCLGAGTPVLMFDGTVKAVEDVRIGDRLMGPDSKPRRVLSLASGREPLYRVTPVKGDPYVVNESHILSLRSIGGVVLNISVLDYAYRVRRDDFYKTKWMGWSVPGILRGDLRALRCSIDVKPIGPGEYFGFEIDGDRLFLLGDFTVTHNTYTFSAIAASAAEKGREVIIIVHRKELMTQASASLTMLEIEHGLISPFFTPDPHKLVQVASVDTLAMRLKRRPHKPKPGGLLVIFDEAHHVLDSNKWGRVYGLLGSPPMLGVTATPIRSDGKGLGAHAGGLFKSMVLGPSVRDLIERGMLVNPLVYTSKFVPDLSKLKVNKDGEYNLQDLASVVDKPRITGDAIEHYTKICPGAKAIAFCTSIAHAKHVAEEFRSAGYRFELLVGSPEMSDGERTMINKKLRRGEIDGVCTVDLVSEGYDLPDLEVCIMLRPTQSESLFLQQVGRAMRPKESGRGCWLLDHVGNVGVMIDGEFKRKHGLPDEEREWSLDGRKKRKGKKKEVEPVIPLKQCPMCFVTHEPMPNCPGCGYEYPDGGRHVEKVDGELGLITPEMQQAYRQQQIAAQAGAKTVDDLVQKMGYSRARAEAIIKARAEKDALRMSLIAALQEWHRETGQSSMDALGIYQADVRQMKPKELKALSVKFDGYKQAYRAAVTAGWTPEAQASLQRFLNMAASPQQGIL